MALQRAVRYNPHDADALSMLGELYALENEGNEIALSLCQQDVNIDDRHWKYWYRLALVRFRMASYESAMVLCERVCNWSGRMKKRRVYDKMGAHAKAAEMFEAVLRIEPEHRDAGAALKKKNIKINEVGIDSQAYKQRYF